MREHVDLEELADRRRLNGEPLWWQTLSVCRVEKADTLLFITAGDRDDDPWYPSEEALTFCNRCPVRVQCLDWALVHNECGTWGATSEYQRRQLRRTGSRATCPACGGHEIVVEDSFEICLGCATSWPALHPVDRRRAAG
jgi:WhiB family redox-sensing transcriptional regulator